MAEHYHLGALSLGPHWQVAEAEGKHPPYRGEYLQSIWVE
jgi:hypothetical protein